MRATYTAEQEQIEAIALEMGADGLASARRVADGSPVDAEPTSSLFGGFSGLAVPEDRGGAGGGLVDLAILVEGLGRHVTPTPFVTHVVALQMALAADIDVTAAASGEERLIAAFAPTPRRDGDVTPGSAVEGIVRSVPDGPGATTAVVADATGWAALASVTSTATRPGLDLTRPTADLVVTSEQPWVPLGDGDARAAVVVAADLCGAGRGAIAHASEYAGQRQQFGQPIGKFQGVAHQLAEAIAYLDAAWSLTLYAAWALDARAPDAIVSAHAAKARAGHAAVHAAERALQVHGGIGMTWEADAHLFLRRAIASDAWLGSRSAHRRALGAALVGGADLVGAR